MFDRVLNTPLEDLCKIKRMKRKVHIKRPNQFGIAYLELNTR